MSDVASIHRTAIQLTRRAVEMTTEAGSGHPSSAASLAHVVAVLLYRLMRYDPAQPDDPAADRLVLSEGHACPIVYAAGADLGLAIGPPGERRAMEPADLHGLRAAGSALDGHPNPAKGFPFFPAATGSLGQGLSMANGLALAARLDGIDKRVYCIIGDGESREGQVWEALDLLIDQRLHAVCPIFNCNGEGQTGLVSPQQSPQRLGAKLMAFGFDVRDVDGHDPAALLRVLGEHARGRPGGTAPMAVVARTIKGWGSPRLQGEGMHGQALSGEEAEAALEDLDRLAAELGAGGSAAPRRPEAPPKPAAGALARRRALEFDHPDYEEALMMLDRRALLEAARVPTRKAHGAALQMLGRVQPDVVVLDGDVSNSTYSEWFAHDERLRDRFVQCRIGEQNMISCAVGLAAGGKVPFASSFGKFLVRGYDQLEMAIISRSNVKLVGSHVGVSLAADGPSQMALADVAFCRALGDAHEDGRPLMYVLTPCDARSAYHLTMAMARHEGPCYLRTMRPPVAHVYGPDDGPAGAFALGGHRVLAEGGDLAIFAWGYLVHEAQTAVARLREDGVHATLVDAYSLPFDAGAIAALVRRSGDLALCVEDNYGPGLGSAVAAAVAQDGSGARVVSMTVNQVPASAREPDEVLAALGLSARHIAERARALLGGR